MSWPDLTAAAALVAAIFVLAGLAIFGLTRLYYRRQAASEARWKILADYALKRRVNQRELSRLRGFFQNLSESDQNEVLHSRRRLHARLHDFLVHDAGGPVRERVTLLDKLFPPVQSEESIEIKSERDIQIGETVAVEWPGHRFLGTVVRRTENGELWVSITDFEPTAKPLSQEAQLFAYRPGLGGFVLHGMIARAGRDGVVFHPSGRAESFGEQHLMALLDLPTRLQPWRPEDGPPGATADPNGELEPGGTETTEAPPPTLEGRAERISDRGLLFLPAQDAGETAERLFGLYEVWEAEIALPDGFLLRCRGRIIPAAAPGRYVFRYSDLSENSRRILWELIKRNNPQRERLA